MSIVLDANALIVLALDRQRAVAVEELLRVWKAEGEELHAPAGDQPCSFKLLAMQFRPFGY